MIILHTKLSLCKIKTLFDNKISIERMTLVKSSAKKLSIIAITKTNQTKNRIYCI